MKTEQFTELRSGQFKIDDSLNILIYNNLRLREIPKSLRKPVDKLTTFQQVLGVYIRHKKHNDKYLE